MRGHSLRRTVTLTAAAALVTTMASVSPASGDPGTPSGGPPVTDFQGELTGSASVDNRTGATQPTSAQRARANQLGSQVEWNAFGTPATLFVDPSQRVAVTAQGDPVAIAQAFLAGNQGLFSLSSQSVRNMEVLLSRPMGEGSIVVMRQRFGDLPAATDGLVSVGISKGAVAFVTSSLTQDTAAPAPATVSEKEALAVATENAGLTADKVSRSRTRLAAVPMPAGAPRAAYQVVLVGSNPADPTAFTTYVDARTGEVLLRDDLVEFEADNPQWDVFPANPPADGSSEDTRETWCLTAADGCDHVVSDPNGIGWDMDPTIGTPSLTSLGNAALTTEKWDSLSSGDIGIRTSAPSPTRDYQYEWTNQWAESGCDPAVFDSPEQNDIDAAIANLFVMHNRMHDWSYHLGFTEEAWNMQISNGNRGGLGGDPELGNAQAGGRVGGEPPRFRSRNNANQITPPEGFPGITNMFLWQPTPASFYAPCTDGDYDMSVIGHEYGHAITNRMVAGPDDGWGSFQGGSMSEAYSDLLAMEYMFEYGFQPKGETPFVTGGYVTGDPVAGIRNYDMSRSPLNYSNIGYDIVGTEVHADGEIWVAIAFEVRQALVDRYGLGTPELQQSCADGEVPAADCPGNRRWIQLLLDALLLTADDEASMVDIRNAIIAADLIRFGGEDVKLLWNAFARRGLGAFASSDGGSDRSPTPSFVSPFAENGSIRMFPLSAGAAEPVRLYVGDFEARSRPVADTDPATPLSSTLEIAPGTYHFVAVGDGLGSIETTRTIRPGVRGILPLIMLPNVASANNGATASGDGVNLEALIDDTEATNWASLDAPVEGRGVVVDLAGGFQFVTRVQVSALLRPQEDDNADPNGQNRFTALRQFEVLSCAAGFGSDCSDESDFRTVLVSDEDAFPAVAPRPRTPQLSMRDFRIQPTLATHLMIRVLDNQCTGGPDFQGRQHNDPRSTADCDTGRPDVAQDVRIAEFQAFSF